MQQVIDAGSTLIPGDQPTGAPPQASPEEAELTEQAIGSESRANEEIGSEQE